MKVNRAFMEKSGQKELSYYWFPQRGRILTKLYQLKLFTVGEFGGHDPEFWRIQVMSP